MIGARNVRGGLLLLALGLVAGLVMSLYAFAPLVAVPPTLRYYDDLPRRLVRLAHIAAIMLPLINVVLGPWIDRVRLPRRARTAASWLLLLGAAGLPLALALEALLPPLIFWHPAAPPALAFCLGVFVLSAGAWRTDFLKEESHEHAHRSAISGEDRRGAALQTRARIA